MSAADLVLASTSPYRRQLLARLQLPFEQEDPGVEEAHVADESAAARSLRLACEKARAVAERRPGWRVIGSDQVCEVDGRVLGKPGTADRALAQLRRCSGREVRFHTAVALLRDGASWTHVDLTRVHFRELDDATIRRYVEADQPLDCAGSFRCEALGVALFDAIHSDDPTALVGLPLIATARRLREAGVTLP